MKYFKIIGYFINQFLMYYETGKPKTIKCKIVELNEGLYTTLVVQDEETNEYLMLSIFPNWQGIIPKKNDIGYIEFEFVEAGKSKWYDKTKDTYCSFLNTYLIFRKYVPDSSVSGNSEITI